MTIEYRDAIDGETLANLPQAEIEEMSVILHEVRKKTLSGKIVVGQPKYSLENCFSVCDYTCKLEDVFLIRAFDDDKCIGFRFIRPLIYSPVANPKNSEENLKYGHIRDWWLSHELIISEGLAPGLFAAHKDYAGQGIATEIRNRCNIESKRRGFTWIAGYDIDDKSRWDWTMHYYEKNGLEVVLSDIDCPPEIGGYGKIFYYKL